MARLKALVAASVGALVLSATARAADVPGSWPPPDVEQSEAPVIELMSGWYLRGDIGYRYNRVGSVDSASAIVTQDYDNVLGLSAGFGYKHQWFRTDFTVDFSTQGKYRGTTATATTQPQYTAKLDSLSALVNFYIDLGTWSGFTPYIGGGIGATYLGSADYTNSTLPAGVLVSTASKWNLSWAWMAGVALQVTPNWTVDVGYRYLNLGDVISGNEPTTNQITTWRNLSAQEVRVGLRFLLN